MILQHLQGCDLGRYDSNIVEFQFKFSSGFRSLRTCDILLEVTK